jgi:hypothetical protein
MCLTEAAETVSSPLSNIICRRIKGSAGMTAPGDELSKSRYGVLASHPLPPVGNVPRKMLALVLRSLRWSAEGQSSATSWRLSAPAHPRTAGKVTAQWPKIDMPTQRRLRTPLYARPAADLHRSAAEGRAGWLARRPSIQDESWTGRSPARRSAEEGAHR